MEPVPMSHTLAHVLERLRAGASRDDPALQLKLNEAFGKHEARLRAFCRAELTRFPQQVVDEVVQDVLLEAWAKLPEYRPDARFASFLFGVAANKCANIRRKRHDVLTEDGLIELASVERDLLDRLADKDRDDLVEAAARAVLDATEQEVVQLRWVLDYPLDEIADLVGLADADAVRVALQRCRRRMQREIHRRLRAGGHGTSFLRGA